jgi:hypothetical protein
VIARVPTRATTSASDDDPGAAEAVIVRAPPVVEAGRSWSDADRAAGGGGEVGGATGGAQPATPPPRMPSEAKPTHIAPRDRLKKSLLLREGRSMSPPPRVSRRGRDARRGYDPAATETPEEV